MESNADPGRFAEWRWEGLSVCALQTALKLPGSTLCAAATGGHTRMSVLFWWPAAWGTPTWRSCTKETVKVSKMFILYAIFKIRRSAQSKFGYFSFVFVAQSRAPTWCVPVPTPVWLTRPTALTVSCAAQLPAQCPCYLSSQSVATTTSLTAAPATFAAPPASSATP